MRVEVGTFVFHLSSFPKQPVLLLNFDYTRIGQGRDVYICVMHACEDRINRTQVQSTEK